MAKKARWKKTFLRAWRMRAGLTLAKAAEKLGYEDHTMLQKVETQKQPYTQKLLEAAADLYGCEVFDLLYRAPDAPESPYSLLEDMNEAQMRRSVPHLRAIRDER